MKVWFQAFVWFSIHNYFFQQDIVFQQAGFNSSSAEIDGDGKVIHGMKECFVGVGEDTGRKVESNQMIVIDSLDGEIVFRNPKEEKVEA